MNLSLGNDLIIPGMIMFEFDKLCKDYEKLSYGELKQIVAENGLVLLPALKSFSDDAVALMILFIATACGADGKFSPEEYHLFAETTGYSLTYAEMVSAVDNASGKDSRKAVDSVIDMFGSLSDDIKVSMIQFCLAFCAADGKLSLKERSFIKKLIK